MISAGITDPAVFNQAREILLLMGEYFQIQDDYLDAFADPKVLGKVGTDIQDNKCSWLVVQALLRATPEQRRVLEENYGQKDDAKVARIKELYREMDLKGVYERYEEQVVQQLRGMIAAVTAVPQEVYEFQLNKIYKRKK